MPGNSGGAIIKNDKLIGIVSQQPNFPLQDNNDNYYPNTAYRLPYAIAIKAKYIIELLNQWLDSRSIKH